MESNGQEDRIRGGTVRWDRERVRRTLLAYGRSPFNGDHFINGSWKIVLRIKTFRNVPLIRPKETWVAFEIEAGVIAHNYLACRSDMHCPIDVY